MLSFQPLHWKVRIFQWVNVFAICAVLKFEMCSWTWWRFKLIKRWISASYCKRLPVIASPCYEVEFLFTSLLFLRGVMEQFFQRLKKALLKKVLNFIKASWSSITLFVSEFTTSLIMRKKPWCLIEAYLFSLWTRRETDVQLPRLPSI